MKYWDSSALVPLLVEEPTSDELRKLLEKDDQILTWSWTRAEVVSAIERRCRENSDSRARRRNTLAEFISFVRSWYEFSEMHLIQSRALELLAHHPLRAADAGHLATALLCRERSRLLLDFVCLDNRLSQAAAREGFHVVSPNVPEPEQHD